MRTVRRINGFSILPTYTVDTNNTYCEDIAMTSDGQYYFVGEDIVSSFVGPASLYKPWSAVACSSDGAKAVACARYSGTDETGGKIYTTTDYGATWTEQNQVDYWTDVASSSDGTKLIALAYDLTSGSVYTSTNSGVSWTRRYPIQEGYYEDVASTADGATLYVVGMDYQDWAYRLYRSTNSGVSWTAIELSRPLKVAVTPDGTKVVVMNSSGVVYYSKDSGISWVPVYQLADINSYKIAISADGEVIVAATGYYSLQFSRTAGALWTKQDLGNVTVAALSADGNIIAVGGRTTLTFGKWCQV